MKKYLFLFSFLFVFTTSLIYSSNKNLAVIKQGNITSFQNQCDVVCYASYQNDTNFMHRLGTKYHGLLDSAKPESLLRNQNYIEILNCLWTEKDEKKRINWLENHIDQGHPILMLELGLAYCRQQPNLETYVHKSVPWILAGCRRTLLDECCTSDKSVSAASGMLMTIYLSIARDYLFQKHSQDELKAYLNRQKVEFENSNISIHQRVLLPFAQNQDQNMPSPSWVFAHGLGAITNQKNDISATEYSKIRKEKAEEILNKFHK